MSDAVAPLIYVLAFLAVVVLVQTSAGLIFTASDRTTRVNRRLELLESGMSREQVVAALIRRTSNSKFDQLKLARLYAGLAHYCRQAGLSISVERLLVFTLCGAGVLWLAALTVATRAPSGIAGLLNGAISLVAALVIAIGGAWFWLKRMRQRRLKQIEEQLPIALDVVNRALRAGHPIVSAIQLAADELGDPLGTEFGLVVDETAYGVEFVQALTNFAERTGSEDAHYFAVSVNIQSETGGNLAEILEGLARVVRGRSTLSRRVKSLSSEGRASAILISVMPVFVVVVQLLVHAGVYSDKFSDPIFWPVVAVTMIIYLVGWLIVRRIINFRY